MNVLRWLDEHLEATIICIALSLMSVIIFIQVVMRYGFSASLSWSEEVARYLFIWMIYIGIPYGVKTRGHVAVTALDLALKPRGRLNMKIISTFIFLVFAIAATYLGYSVASRIARLGQEAPATGLSMWIVYSAVPVGFALTIFRCIQQLKIMIFEGK